MCPTYRQIISSGPKYTALLFISFSCPVSILVFVSVTRRQKLNRTSSSFSLPLSSAPTTKIGRMTRRGLAAAAADRAPDRSSIHRRRVRIDSPEDRSPLVSLSAARTSLLPQLSPSKHQCRCIVRLSRPRGAITQPRRHDDAMRQDIIRK